MEMKLFFQYEVIFFNFFINLKSSSSTTSWELRQHSRLVVDEDDNGKFRLDRVKVLIAGIAVFVPFEPEITIVISSTTSRDLLAQFSTCRGWRGLEVGEKLKKIAMYWETSFLEIFILKPLVVG